MPVRCSGTNATGGVAFDGLVIDAAMPEAYGVAAADFDGDGWLDVATSSVASGSELRIHKQVPPANATMASSTGTLTPGVEW